MRHFNSLLLSLILAPAIWVLTGFGLVEYGRAGTSLDGHLSPERAVGLGALLLAGILLAGLTLARLSPLGPTLTGLSYLTVAGWVATYPVLAARTLASLPLDLHAEVIRPAQGYAVLLGVPLVLTVFSGRRWRRFEGVPALYAGPAEPRPASAPAAQPAPWAQPAYRRSAVDPGQRDPWRPTTGAPAGSPWAAGPGPGLPVPEDDTDDLSAALLPLRFPPPATG